MNLFPLRRLNETSAGCAVVRVLPPAHAAHHLVAIQDSDAVAASIWRTTFGVTYQAWRRLPLDGSPIERTHGETGLQASETNSQACWESFVCTNNLWREAGKSSSRVMRPTSRSPGRQSSRLSGACTRPGNRSKADACSIKSSGCYRAVPWRDRGATHAATNGDSSPGRRRPAAQIT